MTASTEEDPLVYSAQAAEMCGIKTKTWTNYVLKKYAPPPDDADEERPLNRRMPRWRRSTVEHFRDNRIGQGKRTRSMADEDRVPEPTMPAGIERAEGYASRNAE